MRSLILDRDGVINEDARGFIKSPADFRPLPGALEAIARAHSNGFRIIIVSNQSGLARGLFKITDLNAIHRRLLDDLARYGAYVDAFFFCPHGPDDNCSCRKPKTGLLTAIQQRLGIDLAKTPFVGDRVIDLTAAVRAGARPVLVRTGLEKIDPETLKSIGNIEVFDNLMGAVDAIIAGS
jgi:D-glycero-D-manno-heptose 1,7-bisphosphate phosphatase